MDIASAKVLATAFLSFGMMGAAIGIGLIFAALINGAARNPAAGKTLLGYAFIGGALAELMGLAAILFAVIFAFSK